MFNVLSKFGFDDRFLNWIQACISEPWIAPLVNGRATDFFKATRGLRQGCPLFPLLFVLQASTLSFLLNKKLQEQEINRLCIARGIKNINHAVFADDTLLLGAAFVSSANKFKEVLDVYCEASGNMLNKGKCHIYSWNTLPGFLSSIARCLGFAASSSWSSFKYLGLLVFLKRDFNKDWLPQLEKFKCKLQAWGYSWLNIAGKSVLIKYVLFSLPLFHFSIILAPMGIIRKMEECIRCFFWKGGKQNEKKLPLVNWETISKPLLEGGLHFKNLNHQNIAMGAKIIWKIIVPKPGWVQVALWKKYFSGKRKRYLDTPIQQSNSPFLKLFAKVASLIIEHSFWIPGNEKSIKIWTDRIMHEDALADKTSL